MLSCHKPAIGPTAQRRFRSTVIAFLLSSLGSFAGTAWAAPVAIGFSGSLEDGGSFDGFLYYGDQDIEGVSPENPGGVPDLGRFRGGLWQVDVSGGSTTASGALMNGDGGRALVETTQSASLIAFVLLGPLAGEIPRLELLLEAAPTYDADVQPQLSDIVGFYSTLSSGGRTAASRYQDAFGVSSTVVSLDLFDASALVVPLPGALWCLLSGLGLFALRRSGAPGGG